MWTLCFQSVIRLSGVSWPSDYTTTTRMTMNLLINKKHSENADNSTSVIFDLELWPWPSVKVKKAYVIRCRLLTIVHISNSVEPTSFVLGANTQQYNIHLVIEMKVTLTDDEGHRRRSKVTKNDLMVTCRKLLHSQTSYLVPRYNTISDISLFDLDLRSRSHIKVKGHRRGGVCVLWMLLVSVYFITVIN